MIHFFGTLSRFFAHHLGEACEAVGNDLDGSRREIRADEEMRREIAARQERSRGVVQRTARRSLLPILLGLGLSRHAFAQPRGSWSAGLQLYTVRDQLGADLDGTLRRVADIGYLEVETAGFAGAAADIIRSRLRQHALAAPSMHAGYDDLRGNLDAIVEDAAGLGSRFIVCPSIDAGQRRTADDWRQICRTLNGIGRTVRRHGLTLAYHNHDFEFARLDDGATPFQLMMQETDPEDVKLELDVYWLAKAGLDPAQSLMNARDRVVLVHLKDMAADGSTVELGAGTLRFEPIVRTALLAGASHLFVEQDDSPDPMKSIAASLRFLERLPPDVRPRLRS